MSSAKRLRAEGHPIGEVYLGRDEIAARVDELGREVSRGYAGRLALLVAPLKSSAVFLADLSRALAVDHELDVIELAPYGSGRTGGGVRLLKDLDRPLAGRRGDTGFNPGTSPKADAAPGWPACADIAPAAVRRRAERRG